MKTRTLGKTDLRVSRLGLGLAEIGLELVLKREDEVIRLLNEALDAGITFLDTAACYGDSEALIGRAVAHRRDEFVLATKAGHPNSGHSGALWTAELIADSIEHSLERLKTDHLDLIQLHSCCPEVLEQGDVIRALLDAKQAGKTRYVGYSGDNEAARWAVESGYFDTLQTSYNLVDQRARVDLFPEAQARGLGIIVKRPIANAAWGYGNGASSLYRQRVRKMAEMGPIPGAPDDLILLALGFTLAHDAVDTAIVGTKNPEHVRANVELVEHRLPIPAEVVAELQRRYDELGNDWFQQE
jgi:aryl-alcohol dehydrogenase-like predicted oxidoreductase